jgi:hypothetical protein
MAHLKLKYWVTYGTASLAIYVRKHINYQVHSIVKLMIIHIINRKNA